MEIFQKIKESESIVLDGDKKIGKLTFLLHVLKKRYTKISFVTPLSSNKITKKLETLSRSFLEFNDLKDFIDVFSFREDWIFIKNEYGFNYLLQDLEYFISSQPNDIIVFHRIGSLFDYADRDLIDDFFNHILSYGIKYKKKLIFTVVKEAINYDLISQYLIEASDLYLKIDKAGDVREVEILYALSPILDHIYIFENKHKKLFLFTKEKSGYKKTNISVIVISKNKQIQRLHKYLLEKPQIELTMVDTISDSLEAILKNPDYLIFSQEEEQKVNFSICELSTKHNLYTKTLYLINKPFIRVDDRLKAIEKGCVDVVNFQIQKMHYILELAKYLQNTFYKTSIIHDTKGIDTKEEVLEYIKYLLEERILFTVLKIDGKLEKLDYIREYDKYVELEEYNIVIFVNLLKDEVEHILFKKIEKYCTIVKAQDCIDIFFGEKLCIE